jgi:hypothetical protein
VLTIKLANGYFWTTSLLARSNVSIAITRNAKKAIIVVGSRGSANKSARENHSRPVPWMKHAESMANSNNALPSAFFITQMPASGIQSANTSHQSRCARISAQRMGSRSAQMI